VLLLAGIFLLISTSPTAHALPPNTVYLPLALKMLAPVRMGPFVSRTALAFAIHSSNPAVVYAGIYGGGVYKSYDGGASWSPASKGLPDSAMIQSMAVDPANPLRVYAGLYYNDDPNFASGVYRSDDGGMSWVATARMDNPAANGYSNHVVVYALAVSADGNTVYAGTRTKVPVPPYTYGYGGVFKSINFGATWTLVNNGLPTSDLYIYDLAVNPGNANIVYAALHGNGVFRSSDGGANWSRRNDGMDGYVAYATADRSIALDPAATNQLVFGTASRNTYRSNDQAANWSTSPLYDAYMFSVTASQAHHLFATTTNGSIYFSPDFGQNWGARSTAQTNAYFMVDPTNENVLFGGGGDGASSVKKSVNGGYNFSASAGGISGYPVTGAAVDPSDPSHVFVSTFGWGVMQSTDNGASWTQKNTGLPSNYIQGLAQDPNQLNVLYALTPSSGVYKSTNSGASWNAVSSGYPTAGPELTSLEPAFRIPPPLEPPSGAVEESAPGLDVASPAPGLSAAVSPHSSSNVLVGTAGKGVLRWNGSSWVSDNVSAGSVYALWFDRQTPGRVWLGGDSTAGTLQVSADNGDNWTSAAVGLSDRTVYALAQSSLNPDQLLAGTDAGVYLSTNRGGSWSLLGLSGEAVTAVGFHSTTAGRLTAATKNAVYLSADSGVNWRKADSNLEGYGFLGLTTSPVAAGSYYFYSRYGGLVRVFD
jgi:photosystem II stability/assembly factor-like uncharacterized protein